MNGHAFERRCRRAAGLAGRGDPARVELDCRVAARAPLLAMTLRDTQEKAVSFFALFALFVANL